MSPTTPPLSSQFSDLAAYQAQTGTRYILLPFRFLPLDAQRYVVTNFAGEYLVLPKDQLHALIRHQLPMYTDVYHTLKSRHMVMDADSNVALDLLATKYRTKQAGLAQFTSLFMFVVTLRCNHSCHYCQVSRQSPETTRYDMSPECINKAVDFMFRSPSPSLKVEFQGGEPLLRFDLLRHIVEQVEARNHTERRDLAFVVATNLSLLSDEVLTYAEKHNLYFSTSLDGPQELHNRHRLHPTHDSYERAIAGIQRIRATLGPHRISALMTTTAESLACPTEIIDEYLRQGFHSIFLRSLNPYGYAVQSGLAQQYDVEQWLDFYRRGLAYILQLNRQGVPFREEFAGIILRKILTPYPTGYVDLQSPAGIGISGIILNYDGEVYASDEARMLGEMGDKTFRLGNLQTDAYETIMLSDALLNPLRTTMTEGMPMCADCGLQPYCGSDPVRHYVMQRDMVGFKPSSSFCRKHMAVMTHLIRLLEDDPAAADILNGWI